MSKKKRKHVCPLPWTHGSPVYETLMVDFVNKTVTYEGRAIRCETDALAIPVLTYEPRFVA